MKPALLIRFGLLALLGAVAVIVPKYCTNSIFAVNAFASGAYYYLWVTLIAFLSFWYRFEREPGGMFTPGFWQDPQFRKRLLIAFGVAAASTVFIACVQDYYFKTIWDEHAIQGTALNLHANRFAVVSSRVFHEDGIRYMVSPIYDKRPVAFMFFVSLIYDVFGYWPHGTLFLNAIFSFFIIVFCWLLLERLWGWAAAAFGTVCLLSAPIFVSEASSGGLGICSLFLLLALMSLLVRWMDRPSDDGLTALAFLAVLLAQSRYESIVYYVGFGIVVMAVWWRRKEIRLPLALLLCPLLLVPMIWQQHVFAINPRLWELDTVKKDAAFSLAYIPEMTKEAISFFLLNKERPNQMFLGWLSAFALVAWLVRLPRSLRQRSGLSPAGLVVAAFAPAFALQLLLLLCYAFSLNMPITSRLSLPLLMPMVALAAWTWHTAGRPFFRYGLAIGLGVFLAIHQWPKIGQEEYGPAYSYANLQGRLAEFVDDNTIVVATNAPFFDIYGCNVVTVDSFGLSLAKVKWLMEQPASPRFVYMMIEKFDVASQTWEVKFNTSEISPLTVLEPREVWFEGFQYRVSVFDIVDVRNVKPRMPEKPIETQAEFVAFFYEQLP